MTQWRCDPNTGGLIRSGGKFERVSDLPEIQQHVGWRLGAFRGEFPLALQEGMNWVGGILIKGTDPQEINGEVIDTILGTPGIVEVLAFELQQDVDGVPRRVGIKWDAMASLDDLRSRLPLSGNTIVQAQG